MEQHPIPRQITTFEFKLIGFMTIRQFGYVLLGGAFGYAAFLIVPIFILNYIVGILVFCASLAFAFFPINDRPLDVFIKNLYQRLNSPTQYTFSKNNPSMSIMGDLYFESNPHITLAHADSKEKLAAYLAKKHVLQKDEVDRKNAIGRINTVMSSKPVPQKKQGFIPQLPNIIPQLIPQANNAAEAQHKSQPHADTSQTAKHPFFSGTVTNTRNIPLPGVLVYIKDPETGKALRILKTNPHGIFATFNPLPSKKYNVEIVDSSGNYKFSPVSLALGDGDKHSATFVSKEMI